MSQSRLHLMSRFMFLVAVMACTSGYKFRCYWFCTDTTAIQDDYVEQRDHCRDYAQLKLDMTMKENNLPDDDKTRKATLVSLFSECMGNNGWTVPDGKTDKEKAAATAAAVATPAAGSAAAGTVVAAAAPAAMVQAPPTAEDKARAHAALSRSSECAFARNDAAVSSIAAARAKACDLECAQRLKAAPEAPRPAACPADHDPLLAKGHEGD